VKRIAGAMGAEIEGPDLSKPLDDATFAEIHRAWLENNVIFFRGQNMTPPQYLRFAKRWGDIHLHPYMKGMQENPEIFEIIKKINEDHGVSMLLVEQNVKAALAISDHGYVMENGRIVLSGPADKLRDNEDVKEFYMGISSSGAQKNYREVKHYRRRKRWLS